MSHPYSSDELFSSLTLGELYPGSPVGAIMGAGYGPNDLQLPPGTFSAHNIPVQTMPWVVASALSGATFFTDERLATAYAARLISRGEELEIVMFHLEPVKRFTGKYDAAAVDIEEIRPSLPPGGSSTAGGDS